MEKAEVIHSYFAAWLNKDCTPLRELFAPDVVYSECYGPEYGGLSQVLQWFADWNRKGSVLSWPIRRLYCVKDTVTVEWRFHCVYEGVQGSFDGVSIIEFNSENKILRLREFQSKAEHAFPYGEPNQ